MQIAGLQKLTLIDYPGKLAATVFCVGCNFRCPFCYNPDLVLPEKIRKNPKIPEKDFFGFLKERQGLLEACVIGGGEPTIHPELIEFCEQIKEIGYAIKLDTNGSNPKMIKELIERKLLDYVALDIKAPPEKYAVVMGLNSQMGLEERNLHFWEKNIVKQIEKSIEVLKSSPIDFEFRTTVVPTIHEKEDILKIAKWIKPAKRYYLQNFKAEKTVDPNFEKIKPYSQEYLLEVQKSIAPFFEICQVR